MSCGTSFSCGVHRFDKYKFSQNDKPSNKVLHDENEKRLHNLMQLREEQDQGIFQNASIKPVILQPIISEKQDTTLLHYDHGAVLYYSVSDTKIKKD